MTLDRLISIASLLSLAYFAIAAGFALVGLICLITHYLKLLVEIARSRHPDNKDLFLK